MQIAERLQMGQYSMTVIVALHDQQGPAIVIGQFDQLSCKLPRRKMPVQFCALNTTPSFHVPPPPRTSNRLQNFRWLGQGQSDIAYPPAPETKSSAGRYHAFPSARRRAAMPGPLLLDRRRIRLRRASTNLNPPRTPARPDPAVPPDRRGA